MDVVGLLTQHGVSAFNSVLLAILFVMARGKLIEIAKKVDTLWDWHLVQKGRQRERQFNEDDEL